VAFAALGLVACAAGPSMQNTLAEPSVSAPTLAQAEAAPAAQAPSDESAPAAQAAAEPNELPTACAAGKPGAKASCLPPTKFVTSLCHGTYPDVALAMFARGTPWMRVFAARDVEAWDASRRGRESSMMGQGEEVIVLVDRTGGSGMIVGGGSYDVLRWDGTCASLMADEVTFDKPPVDARSAGIPWRRLDDGIRTALSSDRRIASADADHRRSCRGATLGAKNAACRKAEERLTLLVVEQVRKGTALPAPAHLP
jgi:hypothetical protein